MGLCQLAKRANAVVEAKAGLPEDKADDHQDTGVGGVGGGGLVCAGAVPNAAREIDFQANVDAAAGTAATADFKVLDFHVMVT
ncbi:hypothetical protein CCP3SC15_1390007 [Gammaproteobacteria bacterium]